MMRIAMSGAASGLLRALLFRAAIPRDRILLTECRSVDWHSLTFVGERHEIEVRILAPEASVASERLANGLSDAEFEIPGHILADIRIVGEAKFHEDGSITLKIEALTIAE
jgi:hypothetical protein